MKPYPSVPDLESPPAEQFEGSVWIRELAAGEALRFGVTEGGYLRFAAGERTFEESPPLRLRRSVGHVRRSFDVDALLREASSATGLVFYGVATVRDGVEYDWGRLPPFLGFDAWDGTRERWLPNDAVERAFEGLGLAAVNAFEKELPVRHFYPGRYEIPDSAWYDGPAAGIVVRDSHGNRAARRNPDARTSGDAGPDLPTDPETLAAVVVTEDLVERLAADLDETATFDALFEATLEESFRLGHAVAEGWDESEMRAFRGAVAERVRAFESG
ncbi:MAG: hypothetical protein V5A62_04555 [Haloarculaceae archaeon]